MGGIRMSEETVEDTSQADGFREEVADLCHRQWAGWMEYLFSNGEFTISGGWIMPSWAVDRWRRQVEAPYADLSDEEKDSDRKEADKFISLFAEWKYRDRVGTE